MKISTRVLAGTATLAALTVVLDYSWKYSNLKVPFPWNPVLKFDFTGIPIVLATLLFGFVPGVITSLVAGGAILARSVLPFNSFMKALAEFCTILGIAIGIRVFKKFRKAGASVLGICSRVLIMTFANLTAFYFGLLPLEPLVVALLLIGVFNAIQGALSVYGGYLIYEAITRRAPTILKRAAEKDPKKLKTD